LDGRCWFFSGDSNKLRISLYLQGAQISLIRNGGWGKLKTVFISDFSNARNEKSQTQAVLDAPRLG
jgi:hypothetical protein